MTYIFVLLGFCWLVLAGLPLQSTDTGRERLRVFNPPLPSFNLISRPPSKTARGSIKKSTDVVIGKNSSGDVY